MLMTSQPAKCLTTVNPPFLLRIATLYQPEISDGLNIDHIGTGPVEPLSLSSKGAI